MRVEVAYAQPEHQHLVTVEVAEGTTVESAIIASGLLEACPEIDLANQSVGVFSRIVPLDTPLADHDRVEIYRPLQIDPKAQRRARAKAQRGQR